MPKAPAKKKAIKKVAKKTTKKAPKKAAVKAPASSQDTSSDEPQGLNSEIDASRGAVTVKAKKGAASSAKKPSYSVVMRGGVPTKVEDNGDDL